MFQHVSRLYLPCSSILCVDVPHTPSHSGVDGHLEHLGWFLFRGYYGQCCHDTQFTCSVSSEHVCIPPVYVPSTGMARLHSNATFKLPRNCPTVFQSGQASRCPTSNEQGFQFLHLFSHTLLAHICSFFTNPVNVK